MSSSATPGVEARTGRENRTLAATDAIQPETQSAIPGLSDDVVTAHVLGRIKDPTDLAELRAVSRAMRDAVAATGHRVRGVEVKAAVRLGYLSTLKHLHRQGRLRVYSEGSLQKSLTGKIHEIEATVLHQEAAAKGQLEVLKWLRANGCPWDAQTLTWARDRGQLVLVNWAIANGCPEPLY